MKTHKRHYSRSHANRGAKLEMLVEMTNNQYRNAWLADIRKIPTPVKILNKDGNKVTGHLDTPTWVDYSGIYEGYSIIFDAKETKLKRFPLKNISPHQYQQLKSWNKHGAVAFLLVAFWLEGKNEPEIYVLRFEQLEAVYENQNAGRGSKSISLDFFRENCERVKSDNGIPIDYLTALNLDQSKKLVQQ
ncbi:Holliday junction resolvase RecU [Lysinibacillus sp. Ag94]|uniref:Holliday junction resolvase RecU n=1 Tax=Lysinibacillus sp. Ag94 TaxID=2936682 RepID=UPI00200FE3FC|nr:Holliday junction resolvase RecU [Lysinibacillus sp. Ag94]UPW82745.1 Holliday junction resolvase RecU [Lysinibacillus sp. Ag94]